MTGPEASAPLSPVSAVATAEEVAEAAWADAAKSLHPAMIAPPQAERFELSSEPGCQKGVAGRQACFCRTLPVGQLLEDADGYDILAKLVFCGPHPRQGDEEEAVPSEICLIREWELGQLRRGLRRCHREVVGRGWIQPEGDIRGENMKYICTFRVGLEDDDEFCLVKRLLGKAGCNMRRIADECNAKVRLRGRGSGYLEGSTGLEADMALYLHVSCVTFAEYAAAVKKVASLLQDLHQHYRRYCFSKGMQPPAVQWTVEEVRRDDLRLDKLSGGKAPASSGAATWPLAKRSVPSMTKAQSPSESTDPGVEQRGEGCDGDEQTPRKDDQPFAVVPSTPIGRRAAARAGGARAAAEVSAAAREAQSRQRRDRDWRAQRIQEDWERASRKPGRNAPRGAGTLTRLPADAALTVMPGIAPIGAFETSRSEGAAKREEAKKGKGKGGKGKELQEKESKEPSSGRQSKGPDSFAEATKKPAVPQEPPSPVSTTTLTASPGTGSYLSTFSACASPEAEQSTSECNATDPRDQLPTNLELADSAAGTRRPWSAAPRGPPGTWFSPTKKELDDLYAPLPMAPSMPALEGVPTD
ncbi:KHDC4 [Symbiodinium sp. CCMP2592]|nr:KHDC4 [Symbiodinium sp. CCMP2592]